MEREATAAPLGALYSPLMPLSLSPLRPTRHTHLTPRRPFITQRAREVSPHFTTLHPREQSYMSQMLRTKHRYRLQQKMNNHQHNQPGQQQQAAAKVANGNADNRPLHLQCVDKVHEYPVLEAAFGSFSSFYGRVKVRDQQ